MKEDALSPSESLDVYRVLLENEQGSFSGEPSHLDRIWTSPMHLPLASGSTWTDAYLAAFAIGYQASIVTFDTGMRRWPDLSLTLLDPR